MPEHLTTLAYALPSVRLRVRCEGRTLVEVRAVNGRGLTFKHRLAPAAVGFEAVAFLAGDKAAYITGTTLHVNGGMYMS